MKMMGALKESMTEQDAKRAAAVEIALKVGLIDKCIEHGCLFDAMNDFVLEDAYRLGASLMAENHPTVAVFQGSRNRMNRAIDNVRTGLSNCCDECYYAQSKQ
jgi:hypothetical protein